MSQYDFGTIDPNTKSGTALATDLNTWRNALHSTHGGSTAPSYITAGMLWLDTTSANYKLKLYDGAQSINVGIIDPINNVARVAVDSAATSYITSTTAAQIKFVIASVDTATIRSTGLQFNIASPFITDSSNNELISFTPVASAVNYINIRNSATATNPTIIPAGADTNIGINLIPKGTGRININQLMLDGTTITTTAAQLNFVAGVTSLIQNQLDAKAALASPALTGTPTAPTAAALTNTTQIATTAFVTTANNLKANLASPALTGTPTAPTAAVGTNTTQIATTAFVLANVPAAGGMTLLGTLTTTSGSTQTLSGLTLTDYKFIIVRLNGVSATVNTNINIQGGAGASAGISETMTNVSNLLYSEVSIELATSNAWYISSINNSGGSVKMTATSVTTAVTSITFSPSSGTFDAGTIRVYGVQ